MHSGCFAKEPKNRFQGTTTLLLAPIDSLKNSSNSRRACPATVKWTIDYRIIDYRNIEYRTIHYRNIDYQTIDYQTIDLRNIEQDRSNLVLWTLLNRLSDYRLSE